MDLDAFHKKFTAAESGIKFVAANQSDLEAMLADWKASKKPKPEAPAEPEKAAAEVPDKDPAQLVESGIGLHAT